MINFKFGWKHICDIPKEQAFLYGERTGFDVKSLVDGVGFLIESPFPSSSAVFLKDGVYIVAQREYDPSKPDS